MNKITESTLTDLAVQLKVKLAEAGVVNTPGRNPYAELSPTAKSQLEILQSQLLAAQINNDKAAIDANNRAIQAVLDGEKQRLSAGDTKKQLPTTNTPVPPGGMMTGKDRLGNPVMKGSPADVSPATPTINGITTAPPAGSATTTPPAGSATTTPPAEKGQAPMPDTDRPGLKRGGNPKIYDWQKELGVTPDGYWGDQTDAAAKQKPQIKPPEGVTRNWNPPPKATPTTPTPGADAVLNQKPITQQEFSFTPGSPEEKKFYNDRGLNPPVNGAAPTPLPGASLNVPQQPGTGPRDEEERKRWMETPPAPKVTAPAAPAAPAPTTNGIIPPPLTKKAPPEFGQFTDKTLRETTSYAEDQALARIIQIATHRR